MSATPSNEPPPPGAACNPPSAGAGGTSRLARNILANWTGHFVAVAAGFVIPRLIGDHLGKVQLGIWDLGWSLVNSLPLLVCGVSSAPNRFVARFRAAGDFESLNRTVSACLVVFLIAGSAALLVTIVLSQSVGVFIGEQNIQHVDQARWMVLLLGASLAIQMPIGVYNGVITGTQRYEIVNAIEVAGRILGLVAFFVALVLGGSLVALCAVTLARELVVGVAKYFYAHRLCPELSLSPRVVHRETLKTVIVFGGKSYLAMIADIVLYQGNRILLVSLLGPAALAMFSRPLGLVLAMQNLVQQFGRVMTPVASELQVRGAHADLTRLLLRTTRFALLIALPCVLVLAIFGDAILRLWMGAEYVVGPVVVIVACGHLAGAVQIGPYHILMGMSHHGRAAASILTAAVSSVALSGLLVGVFKLGLVGAALGLVVPVTLVNVVILPALLLHALDLTLGQYLRNIAVGILPVLPSAVVLVAARSIVPDTDGIWVLGSIGIAMLVHVVSALLWVPELRNRLRPRPASRVA